MASYRPKKRRKTGSKPYVHNGKRYASYRNWYYSDEGQAERDEDARFRVARAEHRAYLESDEYERKLFDDLRKLSEIEAQGLEVDYFAGIQDIEDEVAGRIRDADGNDITYKLLDQRSKPTTKTRKREVFYLTQDLVNLLSEHTGVAQWTAYAVGSAQIGQPVDINTLQQVRTELATIYQIRHGQLPFIPTFESLETATAATVTEEQQQNTRNTPKNRLAHAIRMVDDFLTAYTRRNIDPAAAQMFAAKLEDGFRQQGMTFESFETEYQRVIQRDADIRQQRQQN